MNIRQILAAKGADVVTVHSGASAITAAELMSEHGIGALVVSSDDSSVEGLVGERHLVRALVANGGSIAGLTVGDVMLTGCQTCTEDEDINTVVTRMTRTRSRQLPVVDGGRLCGVVSIGDMMKHRLDEIELEHQVLRDAYITKH